MTDHNDDNHDDEYFRFYKGKPWYVITGWVVVQLLVAIGVATLGYWLFGWETGPPGTWRFWSDE